MFFRSRGKSRKKMMEESGEMQMVKNKSIVQGSGNTVIQGKEIKDCDISPYLDAVRGSGSPLSCGEWKELELFFQQRNRELEHDRELSGQSERLRQCAAERDAGKMKKAVCGIPLAVFRAVIGGSAGAAVRALLEKALEG